jgi:hypothetical protein
MRALLCACRESLGGAFSCCTLHMYLQVVIPSPLVAAPTGRSSLALLPPTTRRLGVLTEA